MKSKTTYFCTACGAETPKWQGKCSACGFKFIGEQIGLLEAEGHPERYIFGFEESYGYLSGAHVRDKDAVNASMLCCEMTAWYREQGMTLAQAMDALYAEHGCYHNDLASFTFEGADGMAKMQSIMDTLRSNGPKDLAGDAVTETVDYLAGANGLPKSNVLQYQSASAKILDLERIWKRFQGFKL